MSNATIGIRELKAHLSHTLQQVKAGETVIITERGKPIGRIVPMETSLEDRMQELMAAGVLSWNGKKFQPQRDLALLPRTRGDKTVAELLLEDRE
jgi:prevent-host-death family protein